jgi:glyoxylase-like metal-dependent hydrolase (beta-lactamase superfamily II)
LVSQALHAQAAPEVTLTRLDCGNAPAPAEVARFSDTYAYTDLKVQLTYSCYLIRHGDDYMLWDAGHPVGSPMVKTTIVEQLSALQLTPARIRFVGISHYHGDHTGQVGAFGQSTLLIGKGDWDVLTSPTPVAGIRQSPRQMTSRNMNATSTAMPARIDRAGRMALTSV